MSPRRAPQQAEREREEQAAEDATAALVNAAMELQMRRDQERRERLEAYRDLVLQSAKAGGQLPQSDVARLVGVVEALGLSVEEFQRDVSAVYRDREIEDSIAEVVDQQIAAARERDASAVEEQELRAGFAPIKAEYERQSSEYERNISAVLKRRTAAERSMDRLARQSSDLGSKQTYHRSNHSRVWGRI